MDKKLKQIKEKQAHSIIKENYNYLGIICSRVATKLIVSYTNRNNYFIIFLTFLQSTQRLNRIISPDHNHQKILQEQMSQSSLTNNNTELQNIKDKDAILPLINIGQNDVNINVNQNTIDALIHLMDDNTNICIIMSSDLTGAEKSKMVNSIARYIDKSPKKEECINVSKDQFAATRGISILNKKLYYQGVQIILVDCEGYDITQDNEGKQLSMEREQLENYFNQLFSLSFCIPQLLLIHSNQTNAGSESKNLKQFCKIFSKINKIKQFQLPMMRWNIISGDDQNSISELKQIIMSTSEDKTLCENLQMINLPMQNENIDIFHDKPLENMIESMLKQMIDSNIPNTKAQIVERLNDLAVSVSSGEMEGMISQRIQSKQILSVWKHTQLETEYNKFSNSFEQHLKIETLPSIYNNEFQNMQILLNEKIDNFLKRQGITIHLISLEVKQEILKMMQIEEFPIQFAERISQQETDKMIQEKEQQIDNMLKKYDNLESQNKKFKENLLEIQEYEKQVNNKKENENQLKLEKNKERLAMQLQKELEFQNKFIQSKEQMIQNIENEYQKSIERIKKQFQEAEQLKKKKKQEEINEKEKREYLKLIKEQQFREQEIHHFNQCQEYQRREEIERYKHQKQNIQIQLSEKENEFLNKKQKLDNQIQQIQEGQNQIKII